MPKSSKSSEGPLGKKVSLTAPRQETTYEYWSFRFTSSKVPEFDHLKEWLNKFHAYRFQKEQGEEGEKVVHYQGTFHTKPKKRRQQLRDSAIYYFPELYWPVCDYLEKSKSSAADRYVMKEKTRIDGPWEKNMPKMIPAHLDIRIPDVMEYDELPENMQGIIDMVDNRLPDKTDRKVHWFYDETGCNMKTETARYLEHHHWAVHMQGAKRHVLANAFKNPAPIYVFVVPRDEAVDYVALESLKDSLYMSGFGTDATGSVNRKKPWVLIFANYYPNTSKLSLDKWRIKNVGPPKRLTDMPIWDESSSFNIF